MPDSQTRPFREWKKWGGWLLWLILASFYSYAVVVLHDRFQQPALHVQAKIGMPLWHGGILVLLVVAGLGVWMVTMRFRQIKDKVQADRVAWVGFGLLCLAAGSMLMVNAIEHIHYLQYAILVLLLSRVFPGIVVAMFVAIGIGVIDEFYQFWTLHTWQGYLDFNDLVFNTLGAVFGVLIWRIFSGPQPWKGSIQKASLFWMMAAFGLVLAFQLPFLSVYASESGLFLHRHAAPESYQFASRWIDTGWGNHWFKLSVWESFALVFGIPFIVLLTGKHNKSDRRENTHT